MTQELTLRQIWKSGSLFGGLPSALLDRLEDKVQQTSVKRGQSLFRSGDNVTGCYWIIRGSMKVTRCTTVGEETFLALVGPGDIVGEMGLVDQRPRSATVCAMNDCMLALLANRDFELLAREEPQLYRCLMVSLSLRLRQTNDVVRVQRIPLRNRLAQILLMLAEAFGESLPDERILIRHKISQSELGRMTGFSREVVNRQLGQWRQSKMLSTIGGYYCLDQMAQWSRCSENC